ncbi:MAG: MTH1187 family thiamine-binding protein [Frankiaceae bacterium]
MLVAFSVAPSGGGESMSEVVAEAVRVVRESGLPHETNAMFTLIEGDWDEVMALVRRAVDAVAARAPRVSLVLKADIRAGATDQLHAKVRSVERHLGGESGPPAG